MTEAKAKNAREEILEIFPKLSPENQQIFLTQARTAHAKRSLVSATAVIEVLDTIPHQDC